MNLNEQQLSALKLELISSIMFSVDGSRLSKNKGNGYITLLNLFCANLITNNDFTTINNLCEVAVDQRLKQLTPTLRAV